MLPCCKKLSINKVVSVSVSDHYHGYRTMPVNIKITLGPFGFDAEFVTDCFNDIMRRIIEWVSSVVYI